MRGIVNLRDSSFNLLNFILEGVKIKKKVILFCEKMIQYGRSLINCVTIDSKNDFSLKNISQSSVVNWEINPITICYSYKNW